MKLNITIDDKTYEVEVEASEPESSAPRGFAIEPSAVKVPAPSAAATPKPLDEGPVN